jgi:hypothetical protein
MPTSFLVFFLVFPRAPNRSATTRRLCVTAALQSVTFPTLSHVDRINSFVHKGLAHHPAKRRSFRPVEGICSRK